MYLDFFGLNEKPFKIDTDLKYLYLGPQYQTALSLLKYGVNGGDGITVITGDVGCGKTTMCQALLNDLKQQKTFIIMIDNPPCTREELLSEICVKFGIQTSSYNAAELRDIIRHNLTEMLAAGKRAVIIIDEAQEMSMDMLENVRLVANLGSVEYDQKLLSIILFGQPELTKKLKNKRLRQLKQRISVYYDLRPLKMRELDAYLQHRLRQAGSTGLPVFSFYAKRKIFKFSKGIPRIINNICDKALLSAFVNSSKVVCYKDVINAIKEIKQLS